MAALEPRGGVSKRTGNEWKMQEFVIETHDQYPRKCMFSVFGEDRLKEFHIAVGEELTVSFDIDAREYNGRWYNDIRAWRVQRGAAPEAGAAPAAAAAGAAASAPAAQAPVQAETPVEAPATQDTVDDLPF